MRIPKRLKVGKRWYKVDVIDKMWVKGTMGNTDYDTGRIAVATRSTLTNQRYKEEDVYDTFWHELTHAILKDMGSKLEANEKFVCAFSSRLNNAILSARFK
jgi:hypothetical protein